ncbi:hypothetical protein ILYODFUR_033106 [Ilyodon furcidens]|uniref:Uncharacterized protein n=1 Tax=Ilyodon furcidens TaxID=33524 RepID=A0ABV0TZT6_9TELE
MIDEQFVLHIFIFESLFCLTKTLSDHVQATDLDLASAIDLVFAVVESLIDKRNAEMRTKIWERAIEMCETVDITMQRPPVRRKVQPCHPKEFLVNSQTRLRNPLETLDHCFFPVINRLIN